MTNLRYVHTDALSAALNMAVDDILLDAARAGAGPILRTYAWSPPAVSIGYAQRADEAIDVDRCRARGIDLVRRTTGGRAVLHWNELTYSFHCADGEGPAAQGLQESSRQLGECLAEGLRRFGVDACVERGRVEQGQGAAADRRGACFASTARWELTCGGRKLVGSAQRRTRGALLQHGSILAGPEHLQIAELLPESLDRTGPGGGLDRASTYLQEWLGVVDLRQLAQHLGAAFGDGLGLPTRETTLTDTEMALARERAAEVYGNDDYTFRIRTRPAAAGTA